MTDLPAEECAVLRPGDVLVLRYSRLTPQQAAVIKEQLAAGMPGVTVAVVEADGMAVQRDPQAEEERIREMMAEAGEHPGRMVTRDRGPG